jgi:hypothetical protein
MLHNEALIHAIRLACISPYILNERSVSMMIIAKPEQGKTEAIKQFRFNDKLVYTADITYAGVVGLINMAERDKVYTVLMPDLLKIYMRKYEVSGNFLTILNEVIEEGIQSMYTYRYNFSYDRPVRFNIIAAITEHEFYRQIQMTGQIGFLSRILPFSYAYGEQSVHDIFESIIKGNTHVFNKLEILPNHKNNPSIEHKDISINEMFSRTINDKCSIPMAERFMNVTKTPIHGFRLQKNLQCLAKAEAYLNNRNAVTQEDVDTILKLSKWFNYSFTPLE